MRLIPLSQDKFAQVDDEDYEWLSQWKWYAARRSNTWYAARNIINRNNSEKRTILLMHRFILAPQIEFEIDHIDHNGLNNQRSNLRICTTNQNRFNSIIMSNNTSGHKGVSWRKDRQKWEAYININRLPRKHLGLFDNIDDAIAAYNIAAKELFGEFTYLNSGNFDGENYGK